MTALVASNEIAFHYPDFIRRYNSVGIHKIMNFYKNRLINHYTFAELIVEFEVKSHVIHNNNVNVVYDAIPNYLGNIHFDNSKAKEYLEYKNYPIIKIKKLLCAAYDNKSPPSDFNPYEYKTLHPDLLSFSDADASAHFIKYGIVEGRLYKKNQKVTLCAFLLEYLNKNNSELIATLELTTV
jgi:hypothetical protein